MDEKTKYRYYCFLRKNAWMTLGGLLRQKGRSPFSNELPTSGLRNPSQRHPHFHYVVYKIIPQAQPVDNLGEV
jgi:hypothetical protein